ncbi:DNA polymerase eta [Topomyia yanbarensis]|uniref:DNA polymerase eta n=1 Tax=Topomyia yanbarensis TaxID=2498891 RepID=UPI00273C8F33|nr:DNA polymerase eta [Topomyia yanbarensis]XP_058819375.1 DNA polymerase eta [Topomyia yanbarensis]XP_058819376.1 DNA polymerase eta [Topomyia yanbarensis]
MSKQYININNKYDRVIVLVDMDCFYCQVEEKLNPQIRGKPIAVVQYNPWQGGGIIAVNYPARSKGVTRHMRGDEAKQHCPEIVLQKVPQVRGKADIGKYREAGKEVAAVLQTFTPLLERASVDEAYMDITERVLARLHDMNEGKFQLLPDRLANTYAVGYESVGEFVQKISSDLEGAGDSQEVDNEEHRVEYKKSDIKLLIGASIVNEIRAAVKDKTGYECSAGIAHNKILAKLTASFHKPNKQTILPLKSIAKMYEALPINKVKGLGGKLGEQLCEVLKVQYMADLVKFPEKLLQSHFDERIGSWIYLMAKGIDLEAVTPKFNSKSIGCCKRFPGKNAIVGLATLKHWLGELAVEIQERLEKDMEENNRIAKQMTVSYSQQFGDNDVSSSRSVPILTYDAEKIATDALEAIKRNTDTFLKTGSDSVLKNPIKFLGISAGKFDDNSVRKNGGLREMFSNISSKAQVKELKETDHVEKSPQTVTVDKKDITSFFQMASCRKELANDVQPGTHDLKSSQTDSDKDHLTESSKRAEDHDDSTHLNSENVDNTEENIPNNFLNATLPLEEGDTPQPSTSRTHHIIETNPMIPSSSNFDCPREEITNSTDQTAYDDYRHTYAEYCQVPNVPEIIFKACPECGKSIPEREAQAHLDFHLALQLSEKQREEYRNELKCKFSSPKVKDKIPTPTMKTKLTQFLSPIVVQSTTTSTMSEKCAECGKLIATENLSDHMDYHVARKLQLELNQLEMRTVTVPMTQTSKAITTAGNKRKRSTNDKHNQSVKVNNLTSYFTKMS